MGHNCLHTLVAGALLWPIGPCWDIMLPRLGQGPGQCGKCACRLGMLHMHLKETHAHMINSKHVVMALLKKSSMLFWAFCWLAQFDFLWIGWSYYSRAQSYWIYYWQCQYAKMEILAICNIMWSLISYCPILAKYILVPMLNSHNWPIRTLPLD